MSSSNSHSSAFSNSSISIPCEIEDEFVETESKTEFEASHGGHVDSEFSDEEAYLDEPIADEAWLTEYYRKREEDEERMRDLELRFKGNKPITSW